VENNRKQHSNNRMFQSEETPELATIRLEVNGLMLCFVLWIVSFGTYGHWQISPDGMFYTD
jgi:hypothetical protein